MIPLGTPKECLLEIDLEWSCFSFLSVLNMLFLFADVNVQRVLKHLTYQWRQVTDIGIGLPILGKTSSQCQVDFCSSEFSPDKTLSVAPSSNMGENARL